MRKAAIPMTACPTERFCSLGRGLLSVVLGLAIAVAIVLGSSPELHERLHPDATASHFCVVTLFASGHCEAASAPPVFAPPEPAPLLARFSAASAGSLAPAHFFALLEHAPPAAA
jgi:hypothetical protein